MVVSRHGVDSTTDIKNIIKEHHFFLSSDLVKDNGWVMKALELLYETFAERGIKVTKQYTWTDGCGGQFKSGNCFWDR
jgi:hypothetical protein